MKVVDRSFSALWTCRKNGTIARGEEAARLERKGKGLECVQYSLWNGSTTLPKLMEGVVGVSVFVGVGECTRDVKDLA